jgi:hypothetical protein
MDIANLPAGMGVPVWWVHLLLVLERPGNSCVLNAQENCAKRERIPYSVNIVATL